MKKRASITTILIMLCLLPAILAIVINVITSSSYMKSTAEKEIEGTLMSTGYTILETFNSFDDGKYWLSGKLLYKGGTNLTELIGTFDAIKEETEIECTFFYGDTRYLTTLVDEDGNRMTMTQCSDTVKEIVLNQGNPYFARNVDIGGHDYYGYYIPIKQEGSVAGMIFTGKPSRDLTAATNAYLSYIMLICLVLIIAIAVLAVFMGKITAKQIRILRDETVTLSEGKLSFPIKINTQIREIHQVADAAEKLRMQLVNVVQTILNCSDTVDTSVGHVDNSLGNCTQAVKELSSTMEELAYGAQRMAAAVEKQSVDMDEISNGITGIAESSQATQEVTKTVSNVSNTAKTNLKNLLKANEYTTQSADNVITSISSVSDAVQQITTAAQMIMEISDQTNLLSLNASIEAARAGEAGRGFAVVASEIQKLAEQSNSSAQQIHSIIEEITAKTEECSKFAGQIQDAVGKEADALQGVNSSFDDVDGNISEASSAVNTITNTVDAVEKNKASILDSVNNLTGISEQNAASAEEANASTEELRANIEQVFQQADELKTVIEQLNESVTFFQL